MNNKELLSEETVNALDTMLRKLASKKINNGHLRMDFEDTVSELWINALKIIEKTGKVDFNYIASASFYKMVDMTRHNIRTEATPYDNETLNRVLPEDLRNAQLHTDRKSDTYVFATCKPERADERLELFDILNLFEKDSKEYKLVETWMKILGIIDEGNYEELPTRAFDGYIAVEVLGYAGSKSSGYSKLRQKVRNILTEAGYRP